jgi:osmotically-inducible protein OsmY
MKNRWVVASTVLALTLVQASSQTSGGGGGGASGGASGGGTTTSGSASTQNGVQNGATVNPNLAPGLQNRQQLPPGLQNRQQLPPGLQNRQQLPPGLAMRTNNVSAFTNQNRFTNQFAGRTNRFGSDTNLSPTGRFGTNGFASTNTFSFTNFNSTTFRDEATTPADRSLLIQIRQTIITQISISGAGAGHFVPIHFRIHSGRVRLMGLVANAEQAQRIQAAVSQMPGVVGVENGLSTLPPDQAATEQDKVILTQIRQVIPLPQPTGPWTPVSFDVRQGAVGIAGIVPSVVESQRIEATVRQVPGVVQTSNTLIVDTSASSNVGTSPASTSPGQ